MSMVCQRDEYIQRDNTNEMPHTCHFISIEKMQIQLILAACHFISFGKIQIQLIFPVFFGNTDAYFESKEIA